MLMEEMVFWTEEEEENNTKNYCENFIEYILEYMITDYFLELNMEELYNKSMEKLEIADDFSESSLYYDFKYEYSI